MSNLDPEKLTKEEIAELDELCTNWREFYGLPPKRGLPQWVIVALVAVFVLSVVAIAILVLAP